MSSEDREALEARIRELELQLAATEERHAVVVEQFEALRGTKTFRYTRAARGAYLWGRDAVQRLLPARDGQVELAGEAYEAWLANRRESAPLPSGRRPLVAVVGAVGGLERQVYRRWAPDVSKETELVAVADPDTELTPEALLEAVRLLDREPEVDLVYGDSDLRRSVVARGAPFFKPDWSPDLFLGLDYLAPFVVVRRETLDAAGGVGDGGYDLRLRLAEHARGIGHVPMVLATTRETNDPAGWRSALEAAVSRRGLGAEVEATPDPRVHRVRRRLATRPTVAILIPSRDQSKLLRRCIESIRSQTTYPDYELIVLDNGGRGPSPATADVRVVPAPGAFNFSRLLNTGAAATDAEQLLFLNDDTEVLAPGWLEAMLEHAERPEVAVVGARLLYPNGTPQHEGVLVGRGGVAGNIRLPSHSPLVHAVRNCAAVTAACMMTRREVFDELGGFDVDLRVAFNDVDYCLRARERGYLVVYTPHAQLLHREGASRGRSHPVEDERLFASRWNAAGYRDPYYNPNLSLLHPYQLRHGGAYPSRPLVFRSR